jgi:UDP-N-acetylglucosamine 1-carboxyvinyltransferase
VIRVVGVAQLHGATHQVTPDRIETGTYALAAAMAGGSVRLTRTRPEMIESLLAKMEEAGVDIERFDDGVAVKRNGARLTAVEVSTDPYPGFATDLQAQFMALMTQAAGISFITETIFENRFMHAQELARMGANIRLEGRQAIVAGPTPLSGAQVIASDLRASASLVLAALAASGETAIDRVYHIDRGYEKIESKLAGVGARIRRINS